MHIHPSYRFEQYFIEEQGHFPNNAALPVLLYRQVFEIGLLLPGEKIISHLAGNKWKNAWKDGIFDYHHYHSTAHEVLAACQGEISLQLGGENGLVLFFKAGDVLVLPAGVAHKNNTPEASFKCVGAYPEGQFYNMNYGTTGERPQTDEAIRKVKLPLTDPVFGMQGPLLELWSEGSGKPAVS